MKRRRTRKAVYLVGSIESFHTVTHKHKIQLHENFLIKNQLDALMSQIYFWNKTLHVSDSSSVHHQEFFTIHTAMVYVIQVASKLATCMTYTIAVCIVKNS